jgi:hypothetical protein
MATKDMWFNCISQSESSLSIEDMYQNKPGISEADKYQGRRSGIELSRSLWTILRKPPIPKKFRKSAIDDIISFFVSAYSLSLSPPTDAKGIGHR